MPRTSTSPRFTEANKLFMYRLLRDQLGCGKQTFITRVDEVLAQDRLTAEDLGFDSTLQLLEALGADVVKITLFKGGRAYATVLPREDWDKALAAPEIKTPAKGNKPWKKKKGDKSIKPSCPKRVKRDEAPSDSPAAMTDEDDAPALPDRNAAEGSASASDAALSNAATADSTPTAPQKAAARDPRLRNANFSLEGIEADQADTAKDEGEGEADDTAAEANASESEAAPGGDNAAQDAEERAADSPRIALTVTYDPYTGQQGESSLIATPEELAKRAAEKAAAQAARRAAQEATAAAARAAQIARERRAAVIAAAIAERAAQKEAEAARELAEAEARARAEAEADMAAMEDAEHQDDAAQNETAPSEKPVLEQEADDAPNAEISHQEAADKTPKGDASLPTPQEGTDPSATAAKPLAPAADSSSTPTPEPAPVAPALPSDFPLDFSSEVFCPGPLLHSLTMLYPYGADVMGIVSEYCLIARERGSIEASRSKATFSICYLQNGQRATADVVIRRRRDDGMGAAWAIDSVTVADSDDAE